MNINPNLIRGSLDMMILSVLTDGPLYGYLIQKKIRQATGQQVPLPPGTLYPILYRLERKGAITCQWDKSTGRDRKWYQLTEIGQKMLNKETVQWNRYVDCIRKVIQGEVGTGVENVEPDPA